MSISLRMLSLPAGAALMALFAASVPAGAADMAGGYYPPAAKTSGRHVVATTYANEECELLSVTQSGQARTVRICHPVVDVQPVRSRSSSGDAGNGSSFTITQQ